LRFAGRPPGWSARILWPGLWPDRVARQCMPRVRSSHSKPVWPLRTAQSGGRNGTPFRSAVVRAATSGRRRRSLLARRGSRPRVPLARERGSRRRLLLPARSGAGSESDCRLLSLSDDLGQSIEW
jgi:hypothetical protein